MPRKSKKEEFRSWLSECNSASILVKFETYSFNLTLISFSHKSASEYILRAKELYPDAINFEFLNLSGRVQL